MDVWESWERMVARFFGSSMGRLEDAGHGFEGSVGLREDRWKERKLLVETPSGRYTTSQVQGKALHIRVDVPGYDATDLVATREYDALVVRVRERPVTEKPLVQVRLPAFVDIGDGGSG